MISTGSWPTTHAGETAHTFFRPAVILSYAADMAIWGPWPPGFRLTNLLLHILCTLLVYRMARSEGLGDAAALAAGALFAAHPAHVESVAWISGRTDLLCAAFMLGAWLHYRRGRTAASLCLFGLALLSKEMAITLPLLVFLADMMALAGGALTVVTALDIPTAQFLRQLGGAVKPATFWAGLVKAPVFAFLIAMVGCYQGMRVDRSAAGIGLSTTKAVVVSIFLVILVDALFSILFSVLGV